MMEHISHKYVICMQSDRTKTQTPKHNTYLILLSIGRNFEVMMHFA